MIPFLISWFLFIINHFFHKLSEFCSIVIDFVMSTFFKSFVCAVKLIG